MKAKKVLAFALLGIAIFTGTACAFQPEDALSSRHEDSVYTVLRLEDTTRLLKWIFSSENIRLYVPLIFGKKSIPQAMFASELASRLAELMPLRSMAVNVGITRKDLKAQLPFLQMAFTVSPAVSDIVAKIAEGSASASDIAEMLLGDKTASALAETMIKVERDKDNILRVNNDIFMSAKDNLVIVGSSLNEIRLALRALSEEDTRLLAKKTRRFTEKDFAFIHADYETAADLDDDGELDDLDARKYMDKPLEIEFAFNRLADRFIMSMGLNLSKALKKEYADVIIRQTETLAKTKGGNIDTAGIGGKTSPLAAMGGYLNFADLKDNEIWKPIVKSVLRNLRVRFGISEEEAEAVFTGKFSAAVNGTVTFEGFKIPALYTSFTGKEGAAEKVFGKLTKSPHFSKVQEGIYQLDTSISPISCLAQGRGETIGVDFAELASLSEKPELKPALTGLLERESISSMWIDFAGIQDWINNDENGVFSTLAPIAAIMGYGKYVKAVQDVMHSEFSLPSMSMWGDSPEIIHTEFAVKDIDAEKGLLATILKVYQEFQKADTPAPTESGDQTE
ncbi:MAG: hypothetical protein IJR85_07285 [Synergistaceae bacterium]|nr:hypothetical protein [Synergistaceae bacterium]